ncbi:hypothetical protein BS17DRAFT_769372 [Gyrodon lividus]|nr:hypothetical protein BS17DRAFT_769372 [Gyrodon lividus]
MYTDDGFGGVLRDGANELAVGSPGVAFYESKGGCKLRTCLRDLMEEAGDTKDSNIRDLLPFGLAIYRLATLAWCVDLPAHTIVINAIQIYNPKKGQWVGVSSQDVLQFMSKLADNLNAEVALGAVRIWDEAVQWLGYVHFSLIVARGTKVCLMLKSPGLYYGVGVDYEEDNNSLVQKHADMLWLFSLRSVTSQICRIECHDGLTCKEWDIAEEKL